MRRFFSTMAGRLFLILLLGMSAAAMLATVLAEGRRAREIEHHDLLRTADRLNGYVGMLDDSQGELRERLLELGGPGIQSVPPGTPTLGRDTAFTELLQAQYSRFAGVVARTADEQDCRPRMPDFMAPPMRHGLHGGDGGPQGGCRVVNVRLRDGTPLTLALGSPPVTHPPALAADLVYLSLLAVCVGLLSFVVARLASQPLRRLADAADQLGQNLKGRPLSLDGPLEVRRASHAFNVMQQRLQRHLAERTQMLAAITHDLQTPLTRLRLRLEDVPDEPLRERLIGDLAAMGALIREGLDLARSAATSEPFVALDLDSLLESVVEDAAETGGNAVFEQGCAAVLMLRPLAMRRLFSNLVDNALKYGRTARVSTHVSADGVTVYVRDEGPGMAEEELETVFQPFVRLETSRSRETGGAGLGLTIARDLAGNNHATLVLRNRKEGGLEAVVHWAEPPHAKGQAGA
ncbi:ATP-binding protein [Bordetella ansorpii]|uniref:ATP-binding protein n=1 Tax=Bordetella ansorpii TaxID=288768 RepID=UPI0018D32188|nr:ATP-binding protein [Bordetella ansorpii]